MQNEEPQTNDAAEIIPAPPELGAGGLGLSSPAPPESGAGGDSATVPAREDAEALTLVGLGASAGGVEALQEFFADVPPGGDGSAFIVMMHQAAEPESHLVEVLGRATSLPVLPVTTEPVPPERGHVYVIPPARELSTGDGLLVLREAGPQSRPQGSIDQLFRALADAFGPQSVAVILSGAGSDGTLGLGMVKEVGGLTLAQDPGEAQHATMPRSAIATGRVDFVLPARDMARQIAAYWDTSRRMRLPAEAAPSPGQREDTAETERAFTAILRHLRDQTGHDFSQYKRATVLRRIGRRLQMNNLEDLPSYLAFLRRHPAEVEALLADLLISVTQFFRDPEAWEALEREVIPRLFDGKGPDDEVRAWVCGCATGEEAYSVAMLLLEQVARMERPPRVQVFATDLDPRAIAKAREATYPDTIAQDVSPGRLQRWFYPQGDHYLIHREVRETVLFAIHDVLKDTPFSRLDLITCRNLLIYIDRAAQERVFDIFHFGLRPEGRLMLGQSESVGDASALFSPLDKRHRLYARRPVARPIPVMPPVPASARALPLSGLRPMPGRPPDAAGTAPGAAWEDSPPRLSPLAGVHQGLLLSLYAPPSALVGPDRQILHLTSGAARYLRFHEGQPTLDLLQVIASDLRLDVTTALYAAEAEGRDQTRLVQSVPFDDGMRGVVRVTVRLVQEPAEARGCFLVVFEEAAADSEAADAVGDILAAGSDLGVVSQMEGTVAYLQAQLRSTVEQYEAATEELKASNEEQQAVNEELRSVTEELETSREELQSLNEELRTVNQELRNRVDEVSRANSDLQNLLSSTDIATLFVGRDLQVMRYTPAAQSLFNIIPGDVGRPLYHLTHRLDYGAEALVEDVRRVLRHLTPREREVRSRDGRVFLMRLTPYRTLDDHIEGVVLTFPDITDLRHAEEALRESEARRGLALDAAELGTFVWYPREDHGEPDARMRAMLGLRGHGAFNLATVFSQMIHPDDRESYTEEVAKAVDPRGDGKLSAEFRVIHPDHSTHWVAVTALTVFQGEPPQPARMYGTCADITERKLHEQQQGYFPRLSDTLRSLSDAQEILAAVAQMVMNDFGADRCFYCEVEGRNAVIRQDAAREGLPSAAGIYPLDSMPLFQFAMNSGAPLVVSDANAAETMDEELRHLCVRLQIVSFINVPVRKNGRYVANLCITQSAPRTWTGLEVDMAAETAERTWTAVERARAEEAVHESEERLQTVIANLPGAAVFIVDRDLRYQLVGGEALKATGLKMEDFSGRTVFEALPPASVAQHAANYRRAFSGEPFSEEHEEYDRTFLTRGGPLRGADGEVHAVLAVSYDITERKRAADALRDSEARFRAVADLVPDLLWDSGPDGTTTWYNRRWLEYTGQTLEEAVGSEWTDAIHPDDREASARRYREAVEAGRALRHEHRIRRHDGEYRWFLVRAEPLRDDAGRILRWFGAATDIHDQRAALEALERRVAERTADLARSNTARQDMLRRLVAVQEEERRRISRDLHDQTGQLLTGLVLRLKALEDAYPPDADARPVLTDVRRAAEELGREVHNVAVALRPTALDDVGLAQTLLSHVQEWGGQHGIAADFYSPDADGERPSPEAATTVYRIVQEALTNVARHAGADRVSVVLECRRGEVILVVEDDGTGFDVEAALASTERLGLRGMRERAELAGGTLTVESVPGQGTTIVVHIPM